MAASHWRVCQTGITCQVPPPLGDATMTEHEAVSSRTQLFLATAASSSNSSDVDPSSVPSGSSWTILPGTTPDSISKRSMPTPNPLVISDQTAYIPSQTYNYAAAAAGGYPAGYSMYGGTPSAAAYYQQMTSGLRQSALSQYALGNTTSPYYSASLIGNAASGSSAYDYASAYGANYYNGMRSNYYGTALGTAAYQSLSSGLSSSDTASSLDASTAFALKNDSKKSKSSKKKKTGSCSPPEAQYARVFVWESTDVSVLSNAALEAVARRAPSSREPHLLRQTAHQVAQFIFADEPMEDTDQCNVEDAAVDESAAASAASNGGTPGGTAEGDGTALRTNGSDTARRLANKYHALRQTYTEYACNREGLLEQCRPGGQKEVDESIRNIDASLGRRMDNTHRCLEIVTMRNLQSVEKYANVVMAHDSIVNVAAQLLLAGVAPFVPLENIYSTSKCGREAVFERLVSRFGKKCSFVIVTSNPETQAIARKEQMAVWPIMLCDDLVNLYTAQNDFLLGPR